MYIHIYYQYTVEMTFPTLYTTIIDEISQGNPITFIMNNNNDNILSKHEPFADLRHK